MQKIWKVINDCRGLSNLEIIENIFNSRNIENIDRFMNPTKDDLIPYEELCNIQFARDIVINGLNNNKRFTIHFDTDTDGCTAGAIIYRYLNNYTENIDWTINIGKAHGLNGQDLSKYKNTDILIIVDSIDSDPIVYEELYNMGIEMIILDHHDIPYENYALEYVTLVSSNYKYKNSQLSGAGVTWKFCSYLDKHFKTNYSKDLVDLATCGIIADMSDVSEEYMENRYICSLGFNNQINPAIKKINGSFPFNSQAVSFGIAPLINAACRVKKNHLSVELFLSDDSKEIAKIIKEIKGFKEQQNNEIFNIMPIIKKQAEEQINNKVIYIFIDSDLDIAGLIGNKLLEIYQRPLFILRKKFKIDEDGAITREYYGGSMRAIGIEDFKSLINSSGLCTANGHASASGFEIDVDKFEEFKIWTEDILKDIQFKVDIDIDVHLELSDIDRNLIDKIKQIDKITGEGFKPIKFLIDDVKDYEIKSMTDGKHLKIVSPKMDFIKWNYAGDFEDMKDNSILGISMEFIGTLSSGFMGKNFTLQLIIEDFKEIV